MKKFNEILNGVKKEKKLLIIVIIGVVGISLIALSELIPNKTNADLKEKATAASDSSTYEQTLELRLEEIISDVDGVGNVSVMVTLDTSTVTEYAKDEKENYKSGENSTEKSYEGKYVITGNDSGVVLKTNEPTVRGVIVVCEGGDKATVKSDVTSAVRSVLSVDSNKITVLKMKNQEAK